MEQLPTELLLHIFDFVPGNHKKLNKVSHVCRGWHHVVNSNPRLLEKRFAAATQNAQFFKGISKDVFIPLEKRNSIAGLL